MPQELIRDEMMRLQCWDVFRSRSRDHMVPATSVGRFLQRIKINQALPSGDVQVGVVLSDEERAARASQLRAAAERVGGAGRAPGLGITQYGYFHVTNQLFDPSGQFDEAIAVAQAPFDGVVNEIGLNTVGFGSNFLVAVRTERGRSFFQTVTNSSVFPLSMDPSPDFVNPFLVGVPNATPTPELKNLRIPVSAGELIFVVLRQAFVPAVDTNLVEGYVGFQSAQVGRVDDAVGSSTLQLRVGALAAAQQQSSELAGRLAIERERTRRAELEAQARVRVAELAAANKRSAGLPQNNPFNQVLLAPSAEPKFRQRAPVVPPPPPLLEAPPAAPDGKGKTFVAAWTPNDNSIGYLIPDPPPGGKVNVFDGKYTIWSASGKNLGEGFVENVRTDADIPGNSRVSRNLGTTPSPSMNLSTFVPGEGFVGTQLAPGASGRLSLVRR